MLALIKKDKPIEELKSSMISQMDVFLQSETNNFVEMLFKIVDSKEYLNTNASALIKEDKEPVGAKEESPQDVAGKVEEADSTTPVRDHEKLPDARHSFDEREERKRTRVSPPNPGADRRHRGDHRDYPPPPPRRFRSRSRSRSGSPRHDRFRSTRRRSRSPDTFRRRSAEREGRGGRREGREGRTEREGTPTRDEAGGYTPTPTARPPRCRDYDEKGFCLRGDMCKFDHGNDAVVLEDSRGYQPGLPGLTEPYVPGIPAVPGGGISYPPPLLSVPPPGQTSLALPLGSSHVLTLQVILLSASREVMMAEASSRQIRSLTTDDWEAGAEVGVVEDAEDWEVGEEEEEVTTAAPCSPSGTSRWS